MTKESVANGPRRKEEEEEELSSLVMRREREKKRIEGGNSNLKETTITTQGVCTASRGRVEGKGPRLGGNRDNTLSSKIRKEGRS